MEQISGRSREPEREEAVENNSSLARSQPLPIPEPRSVLPVAPTPFGLAGNRHLPIAKTPMQGADGLGARAPRCLTVLGTPLWQGCCLRGAITGERMCLAFHRLGRSV